MRSMTISERLLFDNKNILFSKKVSSNTYIEVKNEVKTTIDYDTDQSIECDILIDEYDIIIFEKLPLKSEMPLLLNKTIGILRVINGTPFITDGVFNVTKKYYLDIFEVTTSNIEDALKFTPTDYSQAKLLGYNSLINHIKKNPLNVKNIDSVYCIIKKDKHET